MLKPDARVELLNGEIIDMSLIGPFHSWIVSGLNDFFAQNAKGRWMVFPQNPLRLDDHSQPQPDIMLVKRADDFSKRHPVPADVLLLIEVSDTTLEFDRAEKLPAYGRAGIKEVWIVNLVDEVVEVYREPHFAGYGSKTILRTGDTAQPLVFPDVSIKLAELLKR